MYSADQGLIRQIHLKTKRKTKLNGMNAGDEDHELVTAPINMKENVFGSLAEGNDLVPGGDLRRVIMRTARTLNARTAAIGSE
eukprot:IDg7809t1